MEEAHDSLEAQLRRLAALVAPLAETVNQHDARLSRLDILIVQHTDRMTHLETLLQNQETINQGVQTTLARIETLLARMIPQGENGREA